MPSQLLIRVGAAAVVPPLGVFLASSTSETFKRDVLINVVLTLMGYLPGKQFEEQ